MGQLLTYFNRIANDLIIRLASHLKYFLNPSLTYMNLYGPLDISESEKMNETSIIYVRNKLKVSSSLYICK